MQFTNIENVSQCIILILDFGFMILDCVAIFDFRFIQYCSKRK